MRSLPKIRAAAWPILILSLLVACQTGTHPIVRKAQQACAASGLDPKDPDFADCVKRRSDAEFEYWLRVMRSNDG